MTTRHRSQTAKRDAVLSSVQDRVLWLAAQMVHHANNVRKNPDGIKVGGHQASSASVVSILTSLMFDFMRSGDRLSVKPHASPVFHAIQFLLGNLDERYLTTLRDSHGLQAYPSRTKDPDFVDFSTGSVGLGSVAPAFAAVVERYLQGHFPSANGVRPRFISLFGDAELDEGTVWEAMVEPELGDNPNVLWVVDLNRQSLDRVIPGIRVQVWREMAAANGWHVIDAKYGSKMEEAFAVPKGELLRESIDSMPNEVYQRLVRESSETLREWLPRYSSAPQELARLTGQWDDAELRAIFTNLGGHDLITLRQAFAEADAAPRPSMVFAYTLKGWRLPSVGDPQNHSVLLSQAQMDALQRELGVDEVWASFPPGSDEAAFCAKAAERLRPPSVPVEVPQIEVPRMLGHSYPAKMSTQQAFGVILVDLAREFPDVAGRIVTVSPDVASTTNLGGWINKMGVWSPHEAPEVPADSTLRSLKWTETPQGRHMELGISESNLFMLLGQLGLSQELFGKLLFPIGSLYDPFVCRALEVLLYTLYSDSRFMMVGTPSGISLSREGGAHQSVITPSIGVGLPGVLYYEPCFAQELEWIVLDGLEKIRTRESSMYLRLSTKRIEQGLLRLPEAEEGVERLRRQVLSGAYRLVDLAGEPGYAPDENVVMLFASGVMIPEAVEASRMLREEGLFATVINVTSPDALFRSFQESVSASMAADPSRLRFLDDVVHDGERQAPIVTVMDGHPHTLAWIGSALGVRSFPLGVSTFGESGSLADLYSEYRIDATSIAAACLGALEG